jgi:hypothetical protein
MTRTAQQPFEQGDVVRVLRGRLKDQQGVVQGYQESRCLVKFASETLAGAVENLVLVALAASDQCSEVAIDAGQLASDQRSENSEPASSVSDRCAEKLQRLRESLIEVAALLRELGTEPGWVDGDRKPNGSSYPRLRWRVDGVIHSRQLSAEEVSLVKARCDRSSLLCAIDRYLMDSNQ